MDHDQHRRQQIKSLSDEGNQLYYDWVRHMLTVATGALTLLVALQGTFVPENPRFLWLLQSSWVGLALSITGAAVILHGRHGMMWRSAQRRLDAPRGDIVERPPLPYRIADRLFPWVLVFSMITLTLFALVNLGRVQPKAEPHGRISPGFQALESSVRN